MTNIPHKIPDNAICAKCGKDFHTDSHAYLVTEVDKQGNEMTDKLTWIHQKCAKKEYTVNWNEISDKVKREIIKLGNKS